MPTAHSLPGCGDTIIDPVPRPSTSVNALASPSFLAPPPASMIGPGTSRPRITVAMKFRATARQSP